MTGHEAPTSPGTSRATSPGTSPGAALQAALLLLPAALLAWPGPGALLADVPTTVSTAAGVTALACLLSAALLVARRVAPRPRVLVLLLVVIAAAELGAWFAGDTFESRRARLTLWSGLVLLLGGASLDARGRGVLAAGLALLSLALTLPALTFLFSAGNLGMAGILGNTGDVSEAALPGAVCGIGVFLQRRGPLGVLGLAATAAYCLYAALVPVHAGVLAFGLAAALALVLSFFRPPLARHARLASLAVLVLAAPYAVRALARGAAAEREVTSVAAEARTEETGDTVHDTLDETSSMGGFEFRWRTARRVPALVLDHPWLGVGPGQFARAFPPYRDPAEIELSSLGRREPTPVEVEHAHSDWLQGFAELGLVGGAAWVLFLLGVGAAALRSALASDATRVALGLAALAALANALANAPLTYGVASPPVLFALFGAVLGANAPEGRAAGRSPRARPYALLLPVLPLLLLVARADQALAFVRHGRALARLPDAAVDLGNETRLSAERLEPVLEDALAACPDSVPALAQRAQLARARGADAAEEEVLVRLLELRPYSFEHLVALGNLAARQGRFADATTAYERAVRVDAQSPVLLKNRLKLALDSGDIDAMVEALTALEARESFDVEWLERSAAEQLLRGRPGLAHLLLSKTGEDYAVHDANVSFQLARELREEGRDLFADGMLANAHLLFARGHMADGKPEVAVRSYFQSLRVSRDYPGLEGGAPLVRLEMAAAQVLASDRDAAASTLTGLRPRATELRELPEWAGQALLDAGLLE